jgi:hypothetical protein
MPNFSGRFEFRAGNGTVHQSGACTLTVDEKTIRLNGPQLQGLAMDLGDVDAIETGDYTISLKIYDGTNILLSQFGKAYQNLLHDLLDTWHERVVQCLLLEDLEEISRVDGFVQLESAEKKISSSAEIRLYKSNLAILPANATGFQWRLSEIDSLNFDASNYALELCSGEDRLILTRLAKRTREFHEQLVEANRILTDKCAQVIHALFPFLAPAQFIQAAALLKEGRMAAVSQLAAIHPSINRALVENAVSARFIPYFNILKQRTAAPGPYFGFKFIRKEEEKGDEEDSSSDSAEEAAMNGEASKPLLELENESLFFWFAFPLAGSAANADRASFVAWECTSQTGRATYVFRLSPTGQSQEMDTAIRKLNRGIVTVNFRREPIYIPDSSLEMQPHLRRYAIARRNLPAIRNLRNLFAGRAIHKSLEQWQNQLQSLAG